MPTVSRFFSRGFHWYLRRYLRRHFNAVRVLKQTFPELPAGEAVICFANHPGWWDPLIAFLINQMYLAPRTPYTPIDQTALEKYPIFGQLGFYGIDLGSLEGAKRFLSVTRELLKHPQTAIWMAPSGRFVDVRRPTEFQPGLGHIAATVSNIALLPVAFEYTFWEERTPESLVAFGDPVRTHTVRQSKDAWQRELERRLAAAQENLAQKAMSRDPAHFEVILDGSGGVGGWYDSFRRLRSLLNGAPFDPRHSRSIDEASGR